MEQLGNPRGLILCTYLYFSTYIHVDRYIHLSRYKLCFDIETKEEPFLHVPSRIYIFRGMEYGDILAFKLSNRLKAEQALVYLGENISK